MGQTTETEIQAGASNAGTGLLPRVKRNRAEVRRKSGETRNCVLGKLYNQNCASVLPLQDPKRG